MPTVVPGLDLVPADLNLAGAEIEMIDLPMRERRLALAVEAVDDVDYVFIDCPPSLGLLTVNAAVAAQALLVPIQCEFYALEGLGLLTHTLALLRRDLNPDLRIAGIVMTLFDGRLALAHQVVDEVRSRFADELLTPLIPRNVRLSEAPSHGLPVNLYDPTCRGAIAYAELAVNLDRRLAAAAGAALAAAQPGSGRVSGAAPGTGRAAPARPRPGARRPARARRRGVRPRAAEAPPRRAGPRRDRPGPRRRQPRAAAPGVRRRALVALGELIRTHGLLHPIVVERVRRRGTSSSPASAACARCESPASAALPGDRAAGGRTRRGSRSRPRSPRTSSAPTSPPSRRLPPTHASPTPSACRTRRSPCAWDAAGRRSPTPSASSALPAPVQRAVVDGRDQRRPCPGAARPARRRPPRGDGPAGRGRRVGRCAAPSRPCRPSWDGAQRPARRCTAPTAQRRRRGAAARHRGACRAAGRARAARTRRPGHHRLPRRR